MNVVIWEVSNGSLVITYVLADRELFTLLRGPLGQRVGGATYDDAAIARERAVHEMEGNEINGFTLRGGIWTCDVEVVPIPAIHSLIHRGRTGDAMRALDPIIKAVRIMGREHR